MPLFKRAAIIGLGLIGASLARALKKHGLVSEVIGCGRGAANLEHALKQGYVDAITHEPAEAVADADLVVLASPVHVFEGIASAISAALNPGVLVMDVGSVKGGLVDRMQALMPADVEFVGCHPIAGSERSGAEASVDGLFEGAQCLITPAGSNTPEAVERARLLWEGVGSIVKVMDPFEHDELLGLVSHFPHLAAFAMVNSIADTRDGAIALSGAGLKDTTRIAMSSPALWRDICMTNRDNVIPVIDSYIRELEAMRRLLAEGDAPGLEQRLAIAEKRRRAVEG